MINVLNISIRRLYLVWDIANRTLIQKTVWKQRRFLMRSSLLRIIVEQYKENLNFIILTRFIRKETSKWMKVMMRKKSWIPSLFIGAPQSAWHSPASLSAISYLAHTLLSTPPEVQSTLRCWLSVALDQLQRTIRELWGSTSNWTAFLSGN